MEPYDTDLMAKDFLMQFSGLALTVGQPLVFSFQDKKMLGLVVKSLEGESSFDKFLFLFYYKSGSHTVLILKRYEENTSKI